jgi:hypothetical protein
MITCSINALKGKIFDSVTTIDTYTGIRFKNKNETYLLCHQQECCEDVYLEEVCGDLEDLEGAEILQAEEASNPEDLPGKPTDVSYTWTFYKFSTCKGYVTARFYGSSNGYYPESVELYRKE